MPQTNKYRLQIPLKVYNVNTYKHLSSCICEWFAKVFIKRLRIGFIHKLKSNKVFIFAVTNCNPNTIRKKTFR